MTQEPRRSSSAPPLKWDSYWRGYAAALEDAENAAQNGQHIAEWVARTRSKFRLPRPERGRA